MRRLLPAEFSDMASIHAKTIEDNLGSLQTVNDLFSSGQWVRPLEFEFAIKCLMRISEQSRKFHAFIEQSGHLPLLVVPLRLPLLIALKDIDAQVTKLIHLFAVLREVMWSNPYQPIEQKLEIQREIRELQLGCDEVLDQVGILEKNLQHEIDKSKFGRRLYSVV